MKYFIQVIDRAVYRLNEISFMIYNVNLYRYILYDRSYITKWIFNKRTGYHSEQNATWKYGKVSKWVI